MIPSTLNDPQDLFDSRLLTEAVAIFTPEIYWLTESCNKAPCDLNDERFTEKIRKRYEIDYRRSKMLPALWKTVKKLQSVPIHENELLKIHLY